MPDSSTAPDQLRALHERYIRAVNEAVATDRVDDTGKLADCYLDEAVELLTSEADRTA